MFFDIISPLCALSPPGNTDERFAHLQCIIHTDIGGEEFDRGITDEGLEDNHRRAGHVSAGILADLLAVQPHCDWGSVGWFA